MNFKDMSRYIGAFIFGVALIAVYKMFDNLGNIFSWFGVVMNVLSPFIIAFVIAYILLVPCRFIEKFLIKRKKKFLVEHRRAISVAVIYILFVLIIILSLVAIIPALISNLVEFYNSLPSLINDFVDRVNGLNLGFTIGEDTLSHIFENKFFSIQDLLSHFNFDTMNKYAQNLVNAGSGVFNVFLAFIVSIYILIDRASMKNLIKRVLNALTNEKTNALLKKYIIRINDYANKYIYCMMVDAVIIFLTAFIVLSVERVSYAPLLALMLGLFNLIPYFGAIIATAVIGIVTLFTGSFVQALIAVLSMIILQQLDSNLIQPKLYSGSLQLKPFWVIFGVMLGGGLFGVIGIFLAVPVTALVKSIVNDILEYYELKKRATSQN